MPGLENLTQAEIKQRNLELYGSKIKALRIKAGISVDELADTLNIGKSSVRNWECGLTRPDPEYLYRMFSILNVEPNDFFGIKGIGGILTNSERKLVDTFRSLDRRSQRDLQSVAEALAKQSYMRKLTQVYASITKVSDYGRYAAAGSSNTEWPDYPEEEQILLYTDSTVRNADEIITVSGDSMEPQFHNGDKVLVEHCSEIRNGDIGIFYVPGIGGVIKQKTYDRLHSLNPDFDDIFPYEDGAELIGRVLGKIDDSMMPEDEEQKLYVEAETEREKDPENFDSYDE